MHSKSVQFLCSCHDISPQSWIFKCVYHLHCTYQAVLKPVCPIFPHMYTLKSQYLTQGLPHFGTSSICLYECKSAGQTWLSWKCRPSTSLFWCFLCETSALLATKSYLSLETWQITWVIFLGLTYMLSVLISHCSIHNLHISLHSKGFLFVAGFWEHMPSTRRGGQAFSQSQAELALTAAPCTHRPAAPAATPCPWRERRVLQSHHTEGEKAGEKSELLQRWCSSVLTAYQPTSMEITH